MSDTAAKLHPLAGNQRPAVDPARSVWLSASAGTGKTQVLTARVLRLLLEPGVQPDQILCLTFTKAGATEMAARINDTLARWVRADEVALISGLKRGRGRALCLQRYSIVRAGACASIPSTPLHNGCWQRFRKKRGSPPARDRWRSTRNCC